MNRSSLTALALALIAAAPLSAQKKEKDPDRKVKGGALPVGWMGRTDRENQKIGDAKFTATASGYSVTSGPAAIYWSEKYKVSGPFTATVTYKQMKAPSHPEAYGLIFQAARLDAKDQSYIYMLVRGDGKFMVNHRAGADVHKVLDWTEHKAIKKQDASGAATNTLSVDWTKADSVRLKVNGMQVHALPLPYLGKPDGYVGLRVNHNLDVQISGFTVTPVKK